MVYIRGDRSDYDDWARAGCTGWGFEDVLPHFRRSENNDRCRGRDDNPLHGGNGPLYVSELRSPNRFSKAFIEAAVQAGIPRNNDFNGPKQEGAGLYQVTQYNGERWNAARAYLHRGDAKDRTFNGGRKNLDVLIETQALRILFEDKRAVAVTVVRNGNVQVLRARREVIISGGVFNSPQLLLASGIGPATQLRAMGVPVLHDLPGIGENLQDHLDVVINTQLPTTELFGASLRGALKLAGEVLRYRHRRTGMVTSNFCEAGAFAKTRPELERPDINLVFVTALIGNRNMGSRRELGHGYSAHACVLRPHSRGRVKLRSPDMRDTPLIDTRLMSDPRDLDSLVEGIKLLRRVLTQPSLANFGGHQMLSEYMADDDGIRAFARSHADCLYHPVGTCKMGVDDMAVVDPSLRVRGTEGLRIVDCSIMPTLIGGNTNAPAMMIGEKAADLIRSAA